MKLLEENIVQVLQDIETRKDKTIKLQETKANVDK
jgi:hypothetical protein